MTVTNKEPMQAWQVFEAIAKKEYSGAGFDAQDIANGAKAFEVTEKQFKWLFDTYAKQYGLPAGHCVIFSFKHNNVEYGFNLKDKKSKAPRYIKDYQKYGYTHIIKRYER